MRGSLLVLVAACGGGSSTPIDAKVADAYDTARCLIKGNYGSLGTVTGTASMAGSAPTVTIVLDMGATGKDDLFFKLVAGKGVFIGGVAPGTYSIAGADANYSTCGL